MLRSGTGDAPKLPLSLGCLANTGFSGPTRVHTPNCISIGSAVLAHLMVVANTHRPRYTSAAIRHTNALCACDAAK